MHLKYNNNRQYIAKSNTSSKKRKVRNSYKRDTNAGKYKGINSIRRNTKGDCRVQTLGLEIITH